MTTIRPVRLEDLEHVLTLSKLTNKMHSEFSDYYSLVDSWEDSWIKFARSMVENKDSLFLVSESEDLTISGYSLCFMRDRPPIYTNSREGYISDLFVKEECRKQGAGSQLVDTMLDFFKDKCVKYITLQYHHQNDIAKKFWDKKGFEVDMCGCLKE
jgi:ribosomal protein S18 acetylase RimI-like enzyme